MQCEVMTICIICTYIMVYVCVSAFACVWSEASHMLRCFRVLAGAVDHWLAGFYLFHLIFISHCFSLYMYHVMFSCYLDSVYCLYFDM